MKEKAEADKHLGELTSILSSMTSIQGSDYTNFCVMMINSYSVGMAMLAACASLEDKPAFIVQHKTLCFLIINMSVGLSKAMSKLRIAEDDPKEKDPEKIRMDLIRDFKAITKRMELPHEAF